jgi:hypothetical protein
LGVEAFDPEDGPLTGTSVVWHSESQGLLGTGTRLPLRSLTCRRHRILVRATDRWQRSESLLTTIALFDYTHGKTPEGAIADLYYALAAQDPDAYERMLGHDFRFLFCLTDRQFAPEMPTTWPREDEVAFVRRLLKDPSAVTQGKIWRIRSLAPSVLQGEARMKAELEGIETHFVVDDQQTLHLLGGRARLFLRRSDRDGAWQVIQWQDLGAETQTSQGTLRIAVRFQQPISP